jgi:hypothetical protein
LKRKRKEKWKEKIIKNKKVRKIRKVERAKIIKKVGERKRKIIKNKMTKLS